MNVNKVVSFDAKKRKRPFINSQSTGYIATASIGLAALSGFAKNKTIRKGHKIMALLALLSVIWHIYSVERYKHQFRRVMVKDV